MAIRGQQGPPSHSHSYQQHGFWSSQEAVNVPALRDDRVSYDPCLTPTLNMQNSVLCR